MQASSAEPVFFIEDIYVTGLLASHCPQVSRVHSPESFVLRPGPRPSAAVDVEVVAAVHLGEAEAEAEVEEEMGALWKAGKKFLDAQLRRRIELDQLLGGTD